GLGVQPGPEGRPRTQPAQRHDRLGDRPRHRHHDHRLRRRLTAAPGGRHSGRDPEGGRMSTIFGHGRLRLYLLKLLDESPRHGYEIISLLRDRFLGIYSPSPGTIYPRLARLEEEGLVTHEEVDGRKV